MKIEVRTPALPESVTDATVAAWHAATGDAVARDAALVDLETDKVVLEVPVPQDGVVREVLHQTGQVVKAGDLLAIIDTEVPTIAPTPAATIAAAPTQPQLVPAAAAETASLPPSARRRVLEQQSRAAPEATLRTPTAAPPAAPKPAPTLPMADQAPSPAVQRTERRLPMSRLRTRIAERLLEVQHNTASLTTFNEVNLKRVSDLRLQYREAFEKKHGVRLGFMSFFVKAVVDALRRFPVVNASIDGADIVYHDYYDIGLAVSTERGLVVPILRDADRLNYAEIEKQIGEFAKKARDGKLSYEELSGGTFSITNGGVFGSMLSTPLLNPPQSAILGMHAIKDRPVVENGELVVRPIMYTALTYDHRLIDGRDAVQFLAAVRDLLEDPGRLLLGV